MDQKYGQARLLFRKLFDDEEQKQEAGKCFESWEAFRGNNKSEKAAILAYSKDIHVILKGAPSVEHEAVKESMKNSIITAKNIENAFSENPTQIVLGRRKKDGSKKWHVFIPSTLERFEKALSQLNTIDAATEATPVQEDERITRKDACTTEPTAAMQTADGMESPTGPRDEAIPVDAPAYFTGQMLKLEKERDELKEERDELKRERGELRQMWTTHNQSNETALDSLEQNKRRRIIDHREHIKKWMDAGMIIIIACESFSYELFDYIQIQIDEEIQRIVLKVGWKMEWDSIPCSNVDKCKPSMMIFFIAHFVVHNFSPF